MQYPGPSESDFTNVEALNAAFLASFRSSTGSAEQCDESQQQLRDLVAALSLVQLERLAATPFLLFTVHEQDPEYWESLFARQSGVSEELFESPGAHDDRGLLAASLGFLWRLAGQNPYTARVVSGASLSWCERLSACTLLELLRAAGSRPALLAPRFTADRAFWNKLLGPGVSSDRNVRRAAQMAALQAMLTQSPAPLTLRAAACRFTPVPAR